MRDDVGGPLRLSILDHTPVSSGSTLGDAFWHSTRLAELAEQVGYERYWVAEHHNMPWLGSSSPAVLIAHVAARTRSLRVGSGGVMLPNHAPLAVVEQFGMLEELHPGRIDLGLGRSSGGDQIASHALRRTDQDYAPLLAELLAFFRGEFPEGHPYGSVTAVPGQGTMPNIWLLGSGTYSAQLAGAIGLPFGHGGHFAAANNISAVAAYRQSFRPSPALQEPYAIVSVGVICAETDEIAERHHHAARVSTVRNLSGTPGPLLSADEIENGPPGEWLPAQEQYVTELFSSHIVGSPSTVKAGLEELAYRTGADEIMIATIMHGYTDRLRSYELIADACLPRNSAQVGNAPAGSTRTAGFVEELRNG
jgi:luciferase family oxidoreductase group 1